MMPPLEVITEINRYSETTRDYFRLIHEENQKLREENAELRSRINQNSRNSSKPPSSDPFVKPKSLREKTSRKPGGQPGHKGKTLHVFEKPDVVMEHKVEQCSHCNADISTHKLDAVKARQVVDVVVTRVVTEHRADVKQYPDCGQQIVALFPAGVSHYLQYGPSYRAIMICLNQGNHVPYDRLSKISRDIFKIPVSCGTLVNMVNECAHSLDISMEFIKKQLLQSPVLHVDETGLRVKGKTQWLHNASNKHYTYTLIASMPFVMLISSESLRQ